ncbi:MAG: iron-containing alcohol dehydrogenase [Bacilli bacterium]|nr:iron-containing alcohol dehydrogenase [Bacilli bacterium]MBR6950080.1 iron-containing alcohol dehydrogenase [Bacilli bacterium]
MKFKGEVIECNYIEYLNNLNGKVLFIYSPTSKEINNLELNNNYIIFNTKELTQNVDELENRIKELGKFDKVVAFGGGTAIDQAKFFGSRLNKKVIVIPTMISTNAYATDKVALYENNKKVTLLAKDPDIILLDKEILKRSTLKNVYGLVDVLSIYTALNDWDLAIEYNNEDISIEYSYAHKLLLETLSFINNHTYEEIINDTHKIFELVGKAGIITDIYGSGKPESGSEHLFAKELEAIKRVPHAISVSNGILLMSLLQNKFSEEVLSAIRKLRVFEDEHLYGINEELLKEAFFNVKVRPDRFTIVNLDNNDLEKTFKDFCNIKNRG